MSNQPVTSTYNIASGARVGAAALLNRTGSHSGNAAVGFVMPVASDNATFTLQVDIGDGTLRTVTDAGGTAVQLTFTASAVVWLDPAITAGAISVALYGDTGNESADREFTMLLRGVQ